MNAITKSQLAQALIYYAVFRPVDNSRGLAQPIDPPGPNKWDVTAYMQSISESDRNDLMAGRGRLVLMDLPNTPDWLLGWDGDYELDLCTCDGDQVIDRLEPGRTRYIATFRPEADQGKYVVPVDPRGPTDFEVTSIIEAFSEEELAEVLDGHNETTDSLRDAPHAPAWVRNWDGPFEVDVTEYAPDNPMPADFIREPKKIALIHGRDVRYIARFIPKGWSAENARQEVSIEPVGPDHWDVTDYFAGKSVEEIEWIVNSEEQLRKLANHGQPYWVTRWIAPFAVAIEVFTKADVHKLEALRQSNRFYDPGKLTQLPISLKASIPDSDGRYGRGVRDGIEALALALYQAGVDLGVIEAAALTAAEGYGNNGDSVHDQIDEMVVVSMEHIDGYERGIEDMDDMKRLGIQHLIPSMTGFRNLLIYVPGEDCVDPDQLIADLDGKVSTGFLMAVKRAMEIGIQYIYFDADVPALDGWPTYDDEGNSEVRTA